MTLSKTLFELLEQENRESASHLENFTDPIVEKLTKQLNKRNFDACITEIELLNRRMSRDLGLHLPDHYESERLTHLTYLLDADRSVCEYIERCLVDYLRTKQTAEQLVFDLGVLDAHDPAQYSPDEFPGVNDNLEAVGRHFSDDVIEVQYRKGLKR